MAVVNNPKLYTREKVENTSSTPLERHIKIENVEVETYNIITKTDIEEVKAITAVEEIKKEVNTNNYIVAEDTVSEEVKDVKQIKNKYTKKYQKK